MLAIDGIRRNDDVTAEANAESAAVASIVSREAAKGLITPATEQRALEGFRLAATGGQRATPLDQARADAIEADALKAMTRSDLPEGVRSQIAKMLVRVGNGIMDGTVEPKINNAFIDHLHALARQPFTPGSEKDLPAEAKITFRGALAQMSRAAQVLEHERLANGTKLAYDPEAGQTGVERAGLPHLDIPLLDADVYYNTRGTLLNPNGTLHIDNAKFSPNTLADRLKDDRKIPRGAAGTGNQTGRQGDWADKGTQSEPRQLRFYMLDRGTSFISLLDDKNIKQLANVIPESQHDVRNIIINDRKYSINEIKALDADLVKAASAHVNAQLQASSNPDTFDKGAAYRKFYKDNAGTADGAMRSVGKVYGKKYPAPTPSLKQGAAWGAAAGATLSVISLARGGKLDLRTAGQVGMATAQGAGLGTLTTALERGITPIIDRRIGTAVEQKTGQIMVSRSLSQGSAEASGLAARTLVSRMAGSTVAGAVVSTVVSAWQNRAGLAHGDSKAIGNVVADTTVGAGSVLAATAAGAAIGSVVPIAGTAVGAVAGFVVGTAVAYGAQITGVRDGIANGVSKAVDWVKGWF